MFLYKYLFEFFNGDRKRTKEVGIDRFESDTYSSTILWPLTESK